MTHDLKTWPVFFNSLRDGSKTFEIRRNDRNFALGDHLLCREFEPVRGHYTNERPLSFRITYVMAGGQFGLLPGWCILGIERILDKEPGARPPVPAAAEIAPDVRIGCVIVEVAPVYQVIEDDRGERHRLTGAEMNPAAESGSDDLPPQRGEFHLWHSPPRRRLFIP